MTVAVAVQVRSDTLRWIGTCRIWPSVRSSKSSHPIADEVIADVTWSLPRPLSIYTSGMFPIHPSNGKVLILAIGSWFWVQPANVTGQDSPARDVGILEALLPKLEGTVPDSGLHHIDIALEQVGLDGDPEILYYLLSYRAEQLYYEGLFDEAMSNALNALEIAKKLSDSILIANEYNLIGLVYENVQNDHDAIPYLRDALSWYPQESEIRYPLSDLYQIHGNLGQALTRVGRLAEAETHLLLSRNLATQEGILRGVALADWALGELKMARGRPREAIDLFHRSMDNAGNDPDVALGDRADLARAWLDVGERDSALFHLKAGLSMLGHVDGLSNTSREGFLRKASLLYKRAGMNEEALVTMMEWYTLDSSINARNQRSAVTALKNLYETNEKLVVEQFQRQLYVEALDRVRRSRKLVLVGGFLGILGLISAILIYRSRVRGMQRLAELDHLRSQQERTIAEFHIREQLARDMHDDLGAGISALKLRCEMAVRQGLNGSMKEEMQIIAGQAGELVNSMRQLLWAMNSGSGSVTDLVAYCSEYAREYLRNTNITLDLRTDDAWPELEMSPEARRNVFLVLKEALHNVVKHSHGNMVEIYMHWDDAFVLRIHDNGHGIDPGHPRIGHNGIRNMERRMLDLGGDLSITNDQGTRIEIRVPAKNFITNRQANARV